MEKRHISKSDGPNNSSVTKKARTKKAAIKKAPTKNRISKSGGPNNSPIVIRTQDFVLGEPVYAKIRFYCPWPAKITNLCGRWCDVFFFGASDR